VVIDIERNGQYQVKLHFMEPDEVGVGKRVFDVSLQGKTVLRELDVARVAGGSRKAIVREFSVAVSDQNLRIELAPKGERSAVISGVEWHEIP
jgi:beta-galactosidase